MRMKEFGLSTAATVGIVVVVVAVVVVGVVAAVILIGGGGPGGDIASATSLSCKVDTTYQGQTMTFDYKAKNLQDPANLKIRVEGTMMGQSVIYIVNAAQNKGWMCVAGTWQEMPIGGLSQYQTQFEGYQSQLSGWTGRDWTYTDPTTGTTVRIYDIVVNPPLDDSLFIH